MPKKIFTKQCQHKKFEDKKIFRQKKMSTKKTVEKDNFGTKNVDENSIQKNQFRH